MVSVSKVSTVGTVGTVSQSVSQSDKFLACKTRKEQAEKLKSLPHYWPGRGVD